MLLLALNKVHSIVRVLSCFLKEFHDYPASFIILTAVRDYLVKQRQEGLRQPPLHKNYDENTIMAAMALESAGSLPLTSVFNKRCATSSIDIIIAAASDSSQGDDDGEGDALEGHSENWRLKQIHEQRHQEDNKARDILHELGMRQQHRQSSHGQAPFSLTAGAAAAAEESTAMGNPPPPGGTRLLTSRTPSLTMMPVVCSVPTTAVLARPRTFPEQSLRDHHYSLDSRYPLGSGPPHPSHARSQQGNNITNSLNHPQRKSPTKKQALCSPTVYPLTLEPFPSYLVNSASMSQDLLRVHENNYAGMKEENDSEIRPPPHVQLMQYHQPHPSVSITSFPAAKILSSDSQWSADHFDDSRGPPSNSQQSFGRRKKLYGDSALGFSRPLSGGRGDNKMPSGLLMRPFSDSNRAGDGDLLRPLTNGDRGSNRQPLMRPFSDRGPSNIGFAEMVTDGMEDVGVVGGMEPPYGRISGRAMTEAEVLRAMNARQSGIEITSAAAYGKPTGDRVWTTHIDNTIPFEVSGTRQQILNQFYGNTLSGDVVGSGWGGRGVPSGHKSSAPISTGPQLLPVQPAFSMDSTEQVMAAAASASWAEWPEPDSTFFSHGSHQ